MSLRLGIKKPTSASQSAKYTTTVIIYPALSHITLNPNHSLPPDLNIPTARPHSSPPTYRNTAMFTLRDHFLSCLLYVISLTIAITTAVFGVLVLHFHKVQSPGRESLMVLIVVELLDLVSIPFYFFKLNIKTCISAISTFSSLGSGMRVLHFLVFKFYDEAIMNSWYTEAFALFYIASVLFKGIALCFDLQFMDSDIMDNFSDRETTDSFHSTERAHEERGGHLGYGKQYPDDYYVSMKPSAATLVDHTGQHQPMNLNIKPSMTSVGPISKMTLTTLSGPFGQSSFQRLPITQQSTSSMNISHKQTNSDYQVRQSIDSHFGTPTLEKFMKKSTDGKVGIERAAINRIPSALLPPHLKAPGHTLPRCQSNIEPLPTNKKNSMPFLYNYDNQVIMPDIPRAQSVAAFPFITSTTTVGKSVDNEALRKLSKLDWLANPAPFRSTATNSRQSPPTHSNPSEQELPKDDLTFSSESDGDRSVNSGGLAALGYFDSARNSISEPHDFFQSAIDATPMQFDDVQLDMEHTAGTKSRSNSHSPHKSISFLKSHSQQNSMSSFTFGRSSSVQSAPGSPKRRIQRSPTRKLSIKNLSLSSIVFDDSESHNDQDGSDIPDLTYVHELQKSPSKQSLPQQQAGRRKSMHSKHPSMSKIHENNVNMTPRRQQHHTEDFLDTPATIRNEDAIKKDGEEEQAVQSTPESYNSRTSIFPSEVIGQYDKEKWKTMERLNMVGQKQQQNSPEQQEVKAKDEAGTETEAPTDDYVVG